MDGQNGRFFLWQFTAVKRSDRLTESHLVHTLKCVSKFKAKIGRYHLGVLNIKGCHNRTFLKNIDLVWISFSQCLQLNYKRYALFQNHISQYYWEFCVFFLFPRWYQLIYELLPSCFYKCKLLVSFQKIYIWENFNNKKL